jgi:hypothetical protein
MRFSSLVSRVESPKVLNSWKEIANYLARAVRTAQRWECNSKLPVHRIGNGPKARCSRLGKSSMRGSNNRRCATLSSLQKAIMHVRHPRFRVSRRAIVGLLKVGDCMPKVTQF